MTKNLRGKTKQMAKNGRFFAMYIRIDNGKMHYKNTETYRCLSSDKDLD